MSGRSGGRLTELVLPDRSLFRCRRSDSRLRSFLSFSGDDMSDPLGLALLRKRLNDRLEVEGVLGLAGAGSVTSSKVGGLMYSSVCVSVRTKVNSFACGKGGGRVPSSSIFSFFLSKSLRGMFLRSVVEDHKLLRVSLVGISRGAVGQDGAISGDPSILAISLDIEAGARHIRHARALECVAAVPAVIG